MQPLLLHLNFGVHTKNKATTLTMGWIVNIFYVHVKNLFWTVYYKSRSRNYWKFENMWNALSEKSFLKEGLFFKRFTRPQIICLSTSLHFSGNSRRYSQGCWEIFYCTFTIVFWIRYESFSTYCSGSENFLREKILFMFVDGKVWKAEEIWPANCSCWQWVLPSTLESVECACSMEP